MSFRLFLFVFAAAAGVSRGDVALATVFGDNMVLQRGRPVSVWGNAAPGEKVTVAYAGHEAAATAGADGKWLALLPALPPSASGELVVKGDNTLRLRNVAVGDVWICAGQSNMRWTVGESMNAEAEIAAANHPAIRHFHVPSTVTDGPAADMRTTAGWQVCSPETVGAFTGAGYFFARDLQPEIGVPVGLVNIAVGGTAAESWVSADVLAAPVFAPIRARWQRYVETHPARKASYEQLIKKWKADYAAAQAAGKPPPPKPRAPQGPGTNAQLSGLYNGMVAPLHRLTFAGIIWYQGEGNAPFWQHYEKLFGALIAQWRRDFVQHDFPFYFVQLANYGAKPPEQRTYVHIREAQAKALVFPKTAMTTAIDIGNPSNVHPLNKQEVGRRLSLIARALTYGENIEYSGPVYASHKIDRGAIRLHFKHAAGLELREGRGGVAFEVAGKDRNFLPAQVRIDGDSLIVSSPEVDKPAAVRYAWHNAPDAILYNGAHLPAFPFRTDDWEY
jgi:sialate O-acetylesterase